MTQRSFIAAFLIFGKTHPLAQVAVFAVTEILMIAYQIKVKPIYSNIETFLGIFNDFCVLACCPFLIVFHYQSEFSESKLTYSWAVVGIILFSVVVNIGGATFNSWKGVFKYCKIKKRIKKEKKAKKEK